MAFESLGALIAMGGHAPYVWAAWCVTAILMAGIVLHARAERRQLLRSLQRRVRREQRLEASRDGTAEVSHQTDGNRHDT